MENSHPLHQNYVHKLRATLNKTYSFLHFSALVAILYYRGAYFFVNGDVKYHNMAPFLPWFVIFVAEFVLSVIWVLKQPLYWRPVIRTVFPEMLPRDNELPRIDVFICTADPNKEPTFDVMNTVISAMALDYPVSKLGIYLSDDAGAYLTLEGMKAAWVFATWWLSFCRRYGVKTICPKAYFMLSEEESSSRKFIEDRKLVQEKYEAFKQRVQDRRDSGEHTGGAKKSSPDQTALVQMIDGRYEEDGAASLNPELREMPLLVYMAREKRLSYPHNFKAGALNSLLRVSSILSNAPYILVLDCDMYCNDSISARQAMCFYLDSKMSSSLGWVNYPHKFHNISESDIYDSQLRIYFTIYHPGADGLQGPSFCGTNFYVRRKALYDIDIGNGNDLKELRELLGSSNELIKSLGNDERPNTINCRELTSELLQEAHLLVSCTYEKGTYWGKKIGFWYDTIVEDAMTGSFLQSKGWRSVYLNPPRPQFLGCATTNLNDILRQSCRWYSGFMDIVLSKYFPLIYSPSRMQFLHKMSLSFLFSEHLYFLPVWCFITIPPICFLYGIPLYPKVSDPFFTPFAFACISSLVRHLCDVHNSRGTASTWLNEQRIWMIKSITCYLYGSLECIFSRLGFGEASFIPTNKAGDDDKSRLYNLGKYDFRTSDMFLIPLVTAVTLNTFTFVGGVVMIIVTRNLDHMFAQLFLSIYAMVASIPVVEGMLLRKDNGRIPLSTTLTSTILSVVVLFLGYLIFFH